MVTICPNHVSIFHVSFLFLHSFISIRSYVNKCCMPLYKHNSKIYSSRQHHTSRHITTRISYIIFSTIFSMMPASDDSRDWFKNRNKKGAVKKKHYPNSRTNNRPIVGYACSDRVYAVCIRPHSFLPFFFGRARLFRFFAFLFAIDVFYHFFFVSSKAFTLWDWMQGLPKFTHTHTYTYTSTSSNTIVYFMKIKQHF